MHVAPYPLSLRAGEQGSERPGHPLVVTQVNEPELASQHRSALSESYHPNRQAATPLCLRAPAPGVTQDTNPRPSHSSPASGHSSTAQETPGEESSPNPWLGASSKQGFVPRHKGPLPLGGTHNSPWASPSVYWLSVRAHIQRGAGTCQGRNQPRMPQLGHGHAVRGLPSGA